MPTQPSTDNFGVLLVNLGTPDQPTAAAVRNYLAEFLWDKRVVDAPRWLWWLVLHGIILRFRPGKVAKLYAAIWNEKSPLLAYSETLAGKLEVALSDSAGKNIPVVAAMTYGNPSITEASRRLRQLGIKKILVLPLYPQFSASTTGAAFDALASQLKPCPDVPEIFFIRDYHDHPAYINALKQQVEQQSIEADKTLFSFHGIPVRYHQQGDPYPEECQTSAQLLAAELGLKPESWQLTYQSRFGREPWLEPYTDERLQQLPGEGYKRINILCPGFAVDCLETLEEIQVENAEIFKQAGGESFNYINCLNDSDLHVNCLLEIIQQKNPWTKRHREL